MALARESRAIRKRNPWEYITWSRFHEESGGMTRSLHAISHGELAAALRYHFVRTGSIHWNAAISCDLHGRSYPRKTIYSGNRRKNDKTGCRNSRSCLARVLGSPAVPGVAAGLEEQSEAVIHTMAAGFTLIRVRLARRLRAVSLNLANILRDSRKFYGGCTLTEA